MKATDEKDSLMEGHKENKNDEVLHGLMRQARRHKVMESRVMAKEVNLGEPELDIEWHAAPFMQKCLCPVEPCVCQSHLLKAGYLPRKLHYINSEKPPREPTHTLVPRLAAAVKADIEITKLLGPKLEQRGPEFCASNCATFLRPVKEGGYLAERKKLIEKYIKEHNLEKKMQYYIKLREGKCLEQIENKKSLEGKVVFSGRKSTEAIWESGAAAEKHVTGEKESVEKLKPDVEKKPSEVKKHDVEKKPSEVKKPDVEKKPSEVKKPDVEKKPSEVKKPDVEKKTHEENAKAEGHPNAKPPPATQRKSIDKKNPKSPSKSGSKLNVRTGLLNPCTCGGKQACLKKEHASSTDNASVVLNTGTYTKIIVDAKENDAKVKDRASSAVSVPRKGSASKEMIAPTKKSTDTVENATGEQKQRDIHITTSQSVFSRSSYPDIPTRDRETEPMFFENKDSCSCKKEECMMKRTKLGVKGPIGRKYFSLI